MRNRQVWTSVEWRKWWFGWVFSNKKYGSTGANLAELEELDIAELSCDEKEQQEYFL